MRLAGVEVTHIIYSLISGRPLRAGSATNNLNFSVTIFSDSEGANVSGSDLWQVATFSQMSKYSALEHHHLTFSYHSGDHNFQHFLFYIIAILSLPTACLFSRARSGSPHFHARATGARLELGLEPIVFHFSAALRD